MDLETFQSSDEPVLESCGRRAEGLRRGPGLALGRARRGAGHDPRAGRRERRGQVDAGQDPGRACTSRTAATLLFDGASRSTSRPGRAPGGRHRGHLPGADAVPRPHRRGEHVHGPPAAPRPAAGSTPGRCTPRPPRSSRSSVCRSTRPGLPRPVHRRPADRRDRQGAVVDARVLVMDEPTAALTGVEVERLFAVVRALRDEGAAVLFISHRLEEVFAICTAGHRDARRALRAHRADRGPDRRRPGPGDGRPRADDAVPTTDDQRPASRCSTSAA